MENVGKVIKHYYNIDMLHSIFQMSKSKPGQIAFFYGSPREW
jgi:hypothetical protein